MAAQYEHDIVAWASEQAQLLRYCRGNSWRRFCGTRVHNHKKSLKIDDFFQNCLSIDENSRFSILEPVCKTMNIV